MLENGTDKIGHGGGGGGGGIVCAYSIGHGYSEKSPSGDGGGDRGSGCADGASAPPKSLPVSGVPKKMNSNKSSRAAAGRRTRC